MSGDHVFRRAVDAIHQELGDDVAYGVLRLAQRAHGPVRSVVWVPTQFTTQPPREINTRCATRRTMYLERWDVECHIVGADFGDLEALREQILAAVRKVMGTASQPTGGVWVTQMTDEAALKHGGAEKAIQRFQWLVHMLEPEHGAGGRTKIRSIETTPEEAVAEETVAGEPFLISSE